MGIGKMVRPSVIVAGAVTRISPRYTKDENDKRIYAHEVVLEQESGAQVGVTVYVPSNGAAAVQLPPIGTVWAVEVTVEESKQYGASLNYERPADSALDRILALGKA